MNGIRLAALPVLLLSLLACDEDELGPNISGVDPFAIQRVEVEPRLDTVYVGDTIAAADPRPYQGVAIGRTGAPLQILLAWRSSAPEVATVDFRGVVRPVGVGSTQIIASAGKQGEATLVVLQEVASVAIAPSAPAGVVGEEIALTALATGPDGEPVRGVAYTWASTNGAVATVDEAGVVELLAAGTSVVTVSGGGRVGQVTVTVSGAQP